MKFELFTNLLTCPSLFDPPLKSNTESTKMQQKKLQRGITYIPVIEIMGNFMALLN